MHLIPESKVLPMNVVTPIMCVMAYMAMIVTQGEMMLDKTVIARKVGGTEDAMGPETRKDFRLRNIDAVSQKSLGLTHVMRAIIS